MLDAASVKISVCMMVKNEEEMLTRALESIREEADDIVVVDTGSEDRTVQIARRFTDRVYFHPWFDDFSAMRNITLSYARGDWIVILDADDQFFRQDPDMGIRDFLRNPTPGSVFTFRLENVGRDGVVDTTFNQVRLFRNHMGFQYRGIVHNQLELGNHRAAPAPFTVRHYGYSLDDEGMERKRARSQALLEKMIREGENLPYAHYQTAKIHASRKDLRKCLEEALEAARLLGEHPEYVMYFDIHYLIASTAFSLKELDLAREEAEKLLGADPKNVDAAFLLLAHDFEKKAWKNVPRVFERYLQCRRHYLEHPEAYPYVVNMARRHEDALYMDGEALIRSGKMESLKDRLSDLWNHSERGPYFLNRLAGSLLEAGRGDLSREFLERALELNPQFAAARSNLETLQKTDRSMQRPYHAGTFAVREPVEMLAWRKLEEGARFLKEGRLDLARPALEAAVRLSEEMDGDLEARRRLLAPACEGVGVILKRLGEDEESRKYLERAVELEPERTEARIALAEVLKRLSLYDAAVGQVEEVLRRAPEDPQAGLARALIRREQGRLREAEKDLVRLVERRPDFALAVFNLGSLYWTMNRRLDALDRLAQAMRLEPRNRDYSRAFFEASAAMEKSPTVSLCMMVKNEEARLGAALESVERAVDEIVVADTGSEDGTADIARSFGVRLVHHPWFDDFSGMRNITLSYARGDWIFILDADEVLEPADIERFRQEASDLSRDVVSFRVLNYLDGGAQISEQNSIRLFRNFKGFRYEGIVHNQLWYQGSCGFSPVRIHHYGYDLGREVKEAKFERTYSLLKRRVEVNPQDILGWYYLVSICHSAGRLDEAVEAGQKVLELAETKGLDLSKQYLADIYPRLGYLYILKGAWEQGTPVLEKGLEVCPEHPELQIHLALCRFLAKDYESALSFLETGYAWYLKFQRGEFRPFYSVQVDDTLIAGNLTNLLLQMDREEATRAKVAEMSLLDPSVVNRGLEKVRQDLDRGNAQGALWHLRWLQFARTEDPAAMEELVQRLVQSGWFAQALDFLERHREQGVLWTPKVSRLRVEALLGVGKTAGALGAAEESRKRFPASPEPVEALVRVLEVRKEHERAARVLEDLLDMSPEEPTVRNRIGEQYYLAHRFDQAEAYFQREIREVRVSPDPLNNLGMVYLGQGKIREAADHFGRCLDLKPDHPEARQNLEICRRMLSEEAPSDPHESTAVGKGK